MTGIYIRGSIREIELFREFCERVGKTQRDVVWSAIIRYTAKNYPEEKVLLKDLKAEERTIRIMNQERESGRYVGGFEKEQEKIEKIQKLIDSERISETCGKKLIKNTEKNYCKTRDIFEKRHLKKKGEVEI